MSRASWPMRDIPVVVWLTALLLVTFAHPYVPAARWLMIHLLLLGAVSHSILVWSKHFADALLRTPTDPTERRRQSRRLVLLNAGVALVVAGIVSSLWPLTLAGASVVTAVVVWHGAALATQVKGSLSSRFAPTVRYYLAAAVALPVGATLGTILARGPGDPLHARLMVAHAAVNLLGWIGLTIVGTLVTLWPTMLRTRIAPGAEAAAQRALPVLIGAVVVAVAGSLLGAPWTAGLGLVGYLAGLGEIARPFALAARSRPPSTYATLSVLSGMSWLTICLSASAVVLFTAPDWATAGPQFGWLTPALAAGFAAQVLFGALSYLLPVVLGGGPAAVRAANAELDRGGALRITVINLGLGVSMLPAPSVVRVICSSLVLLALAAFLPLLFRAIRASRRVKQNPPPRLTREQRAATESTPTQHVGAVATGLALVLLAVAGGVAVDPAVVAVADPASAVGKVTPTGKTVRVDMAAKDMRFFPSTIEVSAGDRLVINLTNTDDTDVHDLVLESGQNSGRLAPGESETVDVGVVGRDFDGWCSVSGHRQMGMVLDIDVTGTGSHDSMDHEADGPSAATDLDFMAEPGPGFKARDARLAPAPDSTVHKRTFTVNEVEREVAPGVTQRLWTFNGTAPGPVLHGKPGDSLTYRFTATRSGIWMYHCSTMPMSAHIANGMFGAVVIDPPDLPDVDRSYLLVQSELYLGPQDGSVDVEKVQAERPDAVVFNGYANQYDHRPLRARTGERVRVWVLDAGPNRSTAFHVVGGQFDTAFAEGAYRLRRANAAKGGSQSLGLQASQGGFVELVFPEAGHYPFVSHRMIDAERGAHGVFDVS